MVLECKNNVMESGARLSPQKAAECVDLFNAEDGALMDKFKTDSPVLAVEVVSRNNAPRQLVSGLDFCVQIQDAT
ncbi:MAG TPA: hypothetical protein DCS63_07640 [Elusimicrobia bacterium]|nr:hypothetical protein [Elusimicrobiota bacterium]